MAEWKKVCCAVDFSDPSRAAMRAAADLAKRFGAELTLVQVGPAHPPSSDVLVSGTGALRTAAQEAEEMLGRWRAEAEELSGLPVRAVTLRGHAAEEIVRHVGAERCDLVVVGTHGRTGVPRLILGSVAERVVREAPCTVLVAREHDTRDEQDTAKEAAQYSGG